MVTDFPRKHPGTTALSQAGQAFAAARSLPLVAGRPPVNARPMEGSRSAGVSCQRGPADDGQCPPTPKPETSVKAGKSGPPVTLHVRSVLMRTCCPMRRRNDAILLNIYSKSVCRPRFLTDTGKQNTELALQGGNPGYSYFVCGSKGITGRSRGNPPSWCAQSDPGRETTASDWQCRHAKVFAFLCDLPSLSPPANGDTQRDEKAPDNDAGGLGDQIRRLLIVFPGATTVVPDPGLPHGKSLSRKD